MKGVRGRRHGNRWVPFAASADASGAFVLGPKGSPAIATGRVVAIDFETTGLASRRIIEFGAIDNSVPSVTFSERVNPGLLIDAAATAIHGISNADVSASPDFGTVWRAFCSKYLSATLEGPNTIIVSYNGFAFDFPVLFNELARVGQSPPAHVVYADMLPHVRKNCFGMLACDTNKLGDVFQAVTKHPLDGAHSALNDAKAVMGLYCIAAGRHLSPPAGAAASASSVSRAPVFQLNVRTAVPRPLETRCVFSRCSKHATVRVKFSAHIVLAVESVATSENNL
jgi:DNA polymerase III epsilon subunit-like protein